MTRVRTLVFALIAVLALTFASVGAADLESYRASLESASAALSGSDPDVEAALSALRGIEPVTLEDGSTVTPDLTLVIAALESEPPDLAAAQAGIASIIDAIDLAGAAVNPDDARETLDEVLARDEFQPEPEVDESRSLWMRFLDWVNGVLDWFFGWVDRVLGGQGGEGSPGSIAMALLGIFVIVGIVAFAVRSVRESMSPGVTRLADGRDAEAHYTSAQARAEAERLFAAGEYRAALRLLYLATLIRWEEAGRLRFDRSLTNREVVARVDVQGDTSLLEQLTPLVDRFDRVWYGGAPCTADDYTTFASLADRAWEVA
ncbi:MAG TPA: DUF4129 domain-containing protein [Thermomicrobiales bacterium]|nr:DUF4129 domain-containing protein [Thermomicrobiales bacterium]